ncbi:MAG: hypothetical protein R3A52_04325 [Polyangiales bacterium]
MVNLGFVLNVIEDPRERREALTRAFALSRAVLSVSAIVGGRAEVERHRAFGDGVLTSRNTFQKYFGHEELGAFIADALGREPVSVGPGLCFVFRRDEDEQDFLEARQRSSGRFGAMPAPPATERAPRAPRAARVKPPSRWERHAELIEDFWRACLALGRAPQEGSSLASESSPTRRGLAQPRYCAASRRESGPTRWRSRAPTHGETCGLLRAQPLRAAALRLPTLGDRARADVREFWGSQAKASGRGSRCCSRCATQAMPRVRRGRGAGAGLAHRGRSPARRAAPQRAAARAARVRRLRGQALRRGQRRRRGESAPRLGKVTLLRYDASAAAQSLLVRR